MAEEAGLTTHLLSEIARIHAGQDKLFEKLSEQGQTLVRNTVIVEDHLRRTILLEGKMDTIQSEVIGIKNHVAKVETVFSILKPTKDKIKWLVILTSLLGGSYSGYQLKDEAGRAKATEALEKIIE